MSCNCNKCSTREPFKLSSFKHDEDGWDYCGFDAIIRVDTLPDVSEGKSNVAYFDGQHMYILSNDKLSWIQLDNGGGSYTLPVATANTLGGIKVGDNLTIDSDGRLSASSSGGGSYTLPAATTETLGGVKIGNSLNVSSDGTLSGNPNIYGFVNKDDVLVILFSTAPTAGEYKLDLTDTSTDTTTSYDLNDKEFYYAITNKNVLYAVRIWHKDKSVYENTVSSWKYFVDNTSFSQAMSDKQNKLTAGSNIEIVDDVISANVNEARAILVNKTVSTTTETSFSKTIDGILFEIAKNTSNYWNIRITNNTGNPIYFVWNCYHHYDTGTRSSSGSALSTSGNSYNVLAAGATSSFLKDNSSALGYGNSSANTLEHTIYIVQNNVPSAYNVLSLLSLEQGQSLTTNIQLFSAVSKLESTAKGQDLTWSNLEGKPFKSIGSGMNVSDAGVLTVPDFSYSLPTASPSVLGGIKVGTNLTIDDNGTLNAASTDISTKQDKDYVIFVGTLAEFNALSSSEQAKYALIGDPNDL